MKIDVKLVSTAAAMLTATGLLIAGSINLISSGELTPEENVAAETHSLPIAGSTEVVFTSHILSGRTLELNIIERTGAGYAKAANPEAETKQEDEVVPIVIEDIKITKYCNAILHIRKEPTADSESLGYLTLADKVKVTGLIEGSKWVRISYKDEFAFVNSDYLVDEKPEIPEPTQPVQSTSTNTGWNGPKLTRAAGRINGPSGQETYYNLPMQGVISIMRSMGYNDEYWVRSDGCKMLGDYIMVAADLNIHPRGSIVQTSLGLGRVCDTGTFTYTNPYQIDIAVTW